MRTRFIAQSNAEYEAGLDMMLRRMEAEVLNSPDPDSVHFDILAVQGAGPVVGFSVGVLKGWAEVSDPALTRPEFDLVTGASSGALVAPFAFIGTESAYESAEQLVLEPPFSFEQPNLFNLNPNRAGILDNDSLRDGLLQVVTTDFIEAIEAGTEDDRSLLISTTNLDFGLSRLWDLGLEIRGREPEAARIRTRDILLASASLPIMLPPVDIDGNLYTDGGVTANIVMGFDRDSLLRLAQRWYERNPDLQMPTVRTWVVIGRKLFIDSQVQQPNYLGVGLRSLAITTEYDRFKFLVLMAYMADELNREPGIRVEMRYIAPPADADLPVDLSQIGDEETMRGVIELGVRMGSDPNNWQQGVPDVFFLREEQ